MNGTITRRDAMRTALAAAAAGAVRAAETRQPFQGLKVGLASYSARKLSLEETLKMLQALGIRYISLKDVHLALDSTPERRRQVREQVTAAGLEILGCGVISLKNDEAQIHHALQYVRDLGAPVAVVSPDPPALPALDRVVRNFDLRVAIHNHGPEDKRFPSPYDVLQAIERLDRRIGCCVDVGHTFRLGIDPAEAIRKCAPRLYDIHMKDLASAERKPRNVPVGTGAMDVVAILRTLVKIRYANHVALEYEAEPENPIPGIAASFGYMRGVLAAT